MRNCDICKDHEAKYDARTIWGPWAFVCDNCFEQHTHNKVELGFATKLTAA
jgi:hypothetical protein